MREPASFTVILKWSDEECREYLVDQRWPDGVACPKCGTLDPYTITRKRPGKNKVTSLFKCRGCKVQFSATTGTIFERSHVSIQNWLAAIHLMCASKKGMSAHEIKRLLDVDYKTAWFMMHRLREAMAMPPLSEKLSGIVEVDETYVGGKPRGGTRPGARSGPRRRDDPTAKAPVVSLVERGGRVRSMHVERVTAATLRTAIRENVERPATIMTDEHGAYRGLERYFAKHETVTHSKGEYARGYVSTNTVEGFFSILKRGTYGTYHHVSKRHLHRYLAEFDFRYNARNVTDKERAASLIRASEGKRLTFRPIKER